LADISFYETGTINVGARQWWAGALHHWRGPAAEWQARQEIETIVEARGLYVVRSMSIAEEVRVLCELGHLREAIALADGIDLTIDAQPRWAVVQRALALIDLGELDDATVDAVRTTRPADERDLRHVVGSVAVLMSAALMRGDTEEAERQLESLGDLQQLVGRDGAVEQLPRLVGLALRTGRGDLVVGLHAIDAVASHHRDPRRGADCGCRGPPRRGVGAAHPCRERVAGVRQRERGATCSSSRADRRPADRPYGARRPRNPRQPAASELRGGRGTVCAGRRRGGATSGGHR